MSSSSKLNPRKAQSKYIFGKVARLVNSIKLPFKGIASLAQSASTVAAPFTDSLGLYASTATTATTVYKAMESPLHSWNNDKVWSVDDVVPVELRDLLESRLDAIASGPYKEYGPDTDGNVQVLINPSMYSYIDGVSYVPDPSIVPPYPYIEDFGYTPDPFAKFKYQWLPAQFYVADDGSVNIKSYINNLDLSNRDLYKAIESVFEYVLPMFEKLLGKHLRSRELQVIVKAVNCVIQPGSETYVGNWHVEGMPHEHIVASGIYYYSISPHLIDSGLKFRNQNLYMDEPMGKAKTVEGRLIAFSNMLQHKVPGITNSSTNMIGTRKILAFFLIDPEEEIISTKHVPEQQWDAIRPRTLEALDDVVMKILGRSMPMEILLQIMGWAKTGLTLEEAHQHRHALLEERRRHLMLQHSFASCHLIIDDTKRRRRFKFF